MRAGGEEPGVNAGVDTSPPLASAQEKLHRGRHLSLVCERRSSGLEPEHRHEQLQITLLFEPGECVYSWLDAQGGRHEETIAGPQFLWLAPQVSHSCRWEKPADLIV